MIRLQIASARWCVAARQLVGSLVDAAPTEGSSVHDLVLRMAPSTTGRGRSLCRRYRHRCGSDHLRVRRQLHGRTEVDIKGQAVCARFINILRTPKNPVPRTDAPLSDLAQGVTLKCGEGSWVR